MLKRWRPFIIGACVIYGLGTAIYMVASYTRYNVPALRESQPVDNPRIWDSWNKTVATEPKPAPTDFSTWDQVSTSRMAEGGFEATAPTLRLRRPEPRELVRAQSESATLSGGMRLDLTSTAVSFDKSQQATLEFGFRSNGDLQVYHGDFVSGLSPLIPIRLFDANTQFELDSTLVKWDDTANGFDAAFEAHLWHGTRVLIVFDLIHGPAQSAEFPAGSDWEAKWETLRMKPLVFATNPKFTVARDKPGYVRWLPQNRTPFGLRKKFPTTVALALAPEWALRQTEVRFIDGQGNHLEVFKNPAYASFSPGVHVDVAAANLAEIETVQITHFPHFDRVIYELDLTERFPSQNRRIRNLMKVEIPSLQLNSKRELFEVIAKTAQVTQHASLGSLRTDEIPFPLHLEQTSPAKLLKLLESHCTTDMVPVIDEFHLELTIAKRKPNRLEQLSTWFESVVPW